MPQKKSAPNAGACLRAMLAPTLCAIALSTNAGVEEDFERAARAHRQGDFRTSVALWTALAEQGQVDAQYNLGLIHHNADGVPTDYAAAMKWYRMAAQQGDKHAQLQIGGMYQRGEGVPADAEQAHRWFTRHLASHHHHDHGPQMAAWRSQAAELVWQRDMRESLARSEVSAAQQIAELKERAARGAAPAAAVPSGAAATVAAAAR